MNYLKDQHNAIIYKYNKYMQVNGTLFYAFEYLMKILETNPDSNIRWYIIIPTNQQKDYLNKLHKLFNTKYPLWNIRTKNKLDLEKVRKYYGYNSPEYNNFLGVTSLLNKAFERIKLITSLELLRLNFNKVLFPCWNSYFGTTLPKNIKERHILQNRETKSIKPDLSLLNDNLSLYPATFWYETNYQRLPDQMNNQIKYNIKICPDYFYPKELFSILRPKGQSKKSRIIAGKPNINNNYEEDQKPSLFNQVLPGIFLDVRRIEYYQNFNRFEENSRIIPEARFYRIPVSVIQIKNGPDINNTRVFTFINDIALYDSSTTRLKDNLDEYILNENDQIIKIFKDN